MKITVEKLTTIKEEIEVGFPLFLDAGDVFDTGGSHETIYRIDEGGTCYLLSKKQYRSGQPPEYEFQRRQFDFKRELHGWLERYGKADESEFTALLSEFRAELAKFGGK